MYVPLCVVDRLWIPFQIPELQLLPSSQRLLLPCVDVYARYRVVSHNHLTKGALNVTGPGPPFDVPLHEYYCSSGLPQHRAIKLGMAVRCRIQQIIRHDDIFVR